MPDKDKSQTFLTRMWNRVKTNQQWIGFFIVVFALLYAFIVVLYEPRHIILDSIYGLLFIFLISGLYHAFITEMKETKKIKLDYVDGLAAASGVVLTYSIAHYLGLNIVLASSMIGLMGYLLVRKYEVAIYCGSFAGMVSVALFDYGEVLILAFICAFIYMLTKPLFTGYGGKLGTVAFMSSLILHSIFHDQFLVIESEFEFVFLMIGSVLGVVVTFYLHNYFKISTILASALTSFVFALMLIYLLPTYSEYCVVIFSASFIGMSSKDKLPNLFFVILSGVILGAIYYIFVLYFNGLGGKLGLMALISVMITTGLSKLFKKDFHLFKHTDEVRN